MVSFCGWLIISHISNFCEFFLKAECDELAQRAEALKEENASLRSEVNRIRSDYEQLVSEN